MYSAYVMSVFVKVVLCLSGVSISILYFAKWKLSRPVGWHFTTVFSAAEDPSESYVKLRDFVLVKLCLALSSFSNEKLSLGFSEEMASEAREKLKINKVTSLAGLFILLFNNFAFLLISIVQKRHEKRWK